MVDAQKIDGSSLEPPERELAESGAITSRSVNAGASGAMGSVPQGSARSAAASVARQRRPNTNIRPNVGRRDMKEYPLTDSDIETLGLTKGGATFFFSAASALLGFVGNQIKLFSWDGVTTSLAQPVPAFALGAAAICFLVGVYLWVANGSAIRRIKREVQFEE